MRAKRESEHVAHTHLRAAAQRPPKARMRYARPPRYAVSWGEVLLAIAVLAPIVFLFAIGLLMAR